MSINCQKDFTITVNESGPYWNTEQSYEATCTAPQIGGPYTAIVLAHTYSSEISQADADAQALAAAQAEAEAAIYCCDGPGDANNLTMTPTILNSDPTHYAVVATPGASSGSFSITETSAPAFPTPMTVGFASELFCNPDPVATLAISGSLTYNAAETTYPPPGSVIFLCQISIQIQDEDSNVIDLDSVDLAYTAMPAGGVLSVAANVPQGRYKFVIAVAGINADITGNFSVASA